VDEERAPIELRGVVKRYGQVTAVNGLDLVVRPGICFGLLGPNGAGKSTTMRMLTTQALADEGRIEVLGHTLPADSKQARMAMGVVPQQDNLDIELTARQVLAVFARLYRVPRAERDAAVERALITVSRWCAMSHCRSTTRRTSCIWRCCWHSQ
jgi:lipooligosaccharide transport system ATP-binding protein